MRLIDRNQAGDLLRFAELIVEEELCINLRGRRMHCTACGDGCPSGALNLTPDNVMLDAALCTGCNSCLPRCPAGALRSTAFVPERFLRALSVHGPTHLHCRVSEDGGGGIVIPCHGVLDARLLAAARGEGVTELSLHGLNRCGECGHGDVRAYIGEVVAQLADWLGMAAPSLDLDPPSGHGGDDIRQDYQDQPHMDRRAFLRFGGAKGLTRAVEWLLPGLATDEEDEEALPFFQADDYPQRVSPYQQALVARARRVPWHAGRALPFSMRHVADSCSVCLSCGERCPTGALRGDATAATRILGFDPAACTDCGLCESLCPEQALLAEPLHDPAALEAGRTALRSMEQRLCRQCGSPFPTTAQSDLCHLCRNEQELDEAWLDMLSG